MDTKTLATLRKENNMSQRTLATKLNVSSGTIGMYESGKRTPSLKQAIEIAKLLDVKLDDLLEPYNTK